jgi:hypothetical protein
MEEEKKLKFIADGARSTLSRVYLTTTIAARHHNFIVSPFIRAEAKRQKAFFLPPFPPRLRPAPSLVCASNASSQARKSIPNGKKKTNENALCCAVCFQYKFSNIIAGPTSSSSSSSPSSLRDFLLEREQGSKNHFISFHAMALSEVKMLCHFPSPSSEHPAVRFALRVDEEARRKDSSPTRGR